MSQGKKKSRNTGDPLVAKLDHAHQQLNELRRLQKVKYSPEENTPKIGPNLVDFFKQSVEKRQTKLGKIAECFERHVPKILAEHCAIESLSKGTLTVLVDSSSHMYDLKQLLLAGLEKKIQAECKSAGVRKIALKAGRWYEGDAAGNRKLRF